MTYSWKSFNTFLINKSYMEYEYNHFWLIISWHYKGKQQKL